MLQIDHLILRVSDAQASARFYEQILGLRHEGHAAPFEVLRVNDHCTVDLLAEPPKDPAHVAFSLDRAAFDAVRARLQAAGIPFGGTPFSRDGQTAAQMGARGWAQALYFYDLDRHNIEIRTHDEALTD
ncbi:MAG: VOC family protein [Proteobacteria bacterium]|nr:VOC family protein [Pseudomonadota bacterium]